MEIYSLKRGRGRTPLPALGARLTRNGIEAQGRPWPRDREGYPSSTEQILAGLRPRGLSDPDSVPEVSDQPVNGSGDVWLLGTTPRRLCDSTNAANVEPMLAGSQPP